PKAHPHGLPEADFRALFTDDRPVIFAYHGYPWLIHRLTYNRTNHDNFHVHGYQEEGTTTTPFDMTVLNELDRYHLALAAVERVPRLAPQLPALRERVAAKLREHTAWICRHGDDLPEV